MYTFWVLSFTLNYFHWVFWVNMGFSMGRSSSEYDFLSFWHKQMYIHIDTVFEIISLGVWPHWVGILKSCNWKGYSSGAVDLCRLQYHACITEPAWPWACECSVYNSWFMRIWRDTGCNNQCFGFILLWSKISNGFLYHGTLWRHELGLMYIFCYSLGK